MIQGLGRCHKSEVAGWSVPKRTTRGGENEFGNLCPIARPQALVSTIVFAIDGQEFRPMLTNGLHHEAAARYQDFLVGKSHAFAEADRFIGSFEAGDAHNGGNHGIYFARPYRLYPCSFAPSQLRPFGSLQP